MTDKPTNDLADDGWETVQTKTPSVIIFDTPGDEFIGVYEGVDHIEPDDDPEEAFDRYIFTGTDGEPYATNISYSLRTAMEKGQVKPGDMVRIRFAQEVNTKRGLNPLKDFEVAVKRAK